LLLLGIWLGAAIFFSAAVAPNVFAGLRGAGLADANAVAGSIISRLLAIVNHGGFEVSVFLLVMSYFTTFGQAKWVRISGMISLAIMAIMTAVGQWVILARMAALRASMQLPIDQIAAGDPRRIEFSSLHRYSVIFLALAMCSGLAAFIFTGMHPTRATTITSP